jgi:16S rRNA (guanine966-N2)-methyltransferase
MRIIAGSAGGLRLDVPKNRVRPTMDRVKAAIFSSLGETVIGARVLDLFAGSGALGLEALSRGAACACFVERDRAAAATIERNLTRTRLSGRVLQRDVFDFLRRPVTTEQFDIIFADPPYEKTENDEAFTALLLGNEKLAALLAPSGTFVLEKRPSEKIPQTAWRILRRKVYGATEVVFLQTFRSPVSGLPSRA